VLPLPRAALDGAAKCLGMRPPLVGCRGWVSGLPLIVGRSSLIASILAPELPPAHRNRWCSARECRFIQFRLPQKLGVLPSAVARIVSRLRQCAADERSADGGDLLPGYV